MSSKIDIDRFICSLINKLINPQFIHKALKDQGLVYRNGEIVEIDKPPLTEEQKPNFNIGDWIVYTGYLLRYSGKESCVMQVESIEEGRYNFTDGSTLCFDSEKDMRLWTIQDAKNGDVLADGNLPFIFKRIDTNKYSYAYCGITVDNGFKIESEGKLGEWTWMQDIKPATKEQRDLLFQKMEEAGYTWNQEELNLEKIDKPDIAYINGVIPNEDEQDIDKSSCTSTKENNKPQTIKFEPETSLSSEDECLQAPPSVFFAYSLPQGFPPLLKEEHYRLVSIDLANLVEYIRKRISSLQEHEVDSFLEDTQNLLLKKAERLQEKVKLMREFHNYYNIPKPEK